MTAMIFGTGGGERRRCDATCHKAKEPQCVCICGGRYHGKGEGAGLWQAIQEYQKEVFGCYGEELAEAMTWKLHEPEARQRSMF